MFFINIKHTDRGDVLYFKFTTFLLPWPQFGLQARALRYLLTFTLHFHHQYLEAHSALFLAVQQVKLGS